MSGKTRADKAALVHAVIWNVVKNDMSRPAGRNKVLVAKRKAHRHRLRCGV